MGRPVGSGGGGFHHAEDNDYRPILTAVCNAEAVGLLVMWKPFESWHREGSESRDMFKLEYSILDTIQANFLSKLLILAIIVATLSLGCEEFRTVFEEVNIWLWAGVHVEMNRLGDDQGSRSERVTTESFIVNREKFQITIPGVEE